jgi:hypothetical protein
LSAYVLAILPTAVDAVQNLDVHGSVPQFVDPPEVVSGGRVPSSRRRDHCRFIMTLAAEKYRFIVTRFAWPQYVIRPRFAFKTKKINCQAI